MDKALPIAFWSSVAGIVVTFGVSLYIGIFNPPASVGDYETFESTPDTPAAPTQEISGSDGTVVPATQP